MVPYARQIWNSSQFFLPPGCDNPAFAIWRRGNLIRVAHVGEGNISGHFQLLKFRIELHQSTLGVIIASAFVDADVDVLRTQFPGELGNGFAQVASKNVFIVPVDHRNVDSFRPMRSILIDCVGLGDQP